MLTKIENLWKELYGDNFEYLDKLKNILKKRKEEVDY